MTEAGTKLPDLASRWQSAMWEMHRANPSRLEFCISVKGEGSRLELRRGDADIGLFQILMSWSCLIAS
jgi:hypothetical protein